MEDGWLSRREQKGELCPSAPRLEGDILALLLRRPVEEVDIEAARPSPCEAGTPPGGALVHEEMPLRHVGYGEMREIEVAQGPGTARIRRLGTYPFPEEGEFIPVAIAPAVGQVAGEVPPFGPVGGMGPVVPRELPRPRGKGLAPRTRIGPCSGREEARSEGAEAKAGKEGGGKA